MSKELIVRLEDRSYPIVVTRDRFRSLGPRLKRMDLGEELFVVSALEAKQRRGGFLKRSVTRSGLGIYFSKVKFPRGKNTEKAKSQKYVDLLIWELVQRSRGGRRIILASLSGGVLGDLTGYVASIFKRGIPYIHIPTTLLSQVDSAIGGKVGIDHPKGKNLLGAFYQPRLVYIDLSFYKNLDALQIQGLRDGLSEVVKYGVISAPKLFFYLEKNHEKILRPNPDQKALEYIVSSCARIKSELVSKDELDNKGKRVILNFGHTLGHAIEQAKDYSNIRHGHAISVGMVCAAEIAAKMRLCGRDLPNRLEKLFLNLKLPTKMKGISLKRLFEAESLDKKFTQGKNRYVLPVRIGKVVVRQGVSRHLIREIASKRVGNDSEE